MKRKLSEKIYRAKNEIQRIWCEMKESNNDSVFKRGVKYSYIIDSENKTVKIVPYNEIYKTKGTVSHKKNGEIAIIDICNNKIKNLFKDFKQYKITIFEDEIFIEGYNEVEEVARKKAKNVINFKAKQKTTRKVLRLPLRYYDVLMKASGLEGQMSFFDTDYSYSIEGFGEDSNEILNSKKVKKDKPIINKSIRLLSLFSGIGAFEEALKNINQPFELVNYCEFQPHIANAYSMIHNEPISKNLGDVTKVDETQLDDFDLMTFGFPCFIAGTKVLTWDGYKNIEDITSEDYVLTHKNRYQKVVKPMINKADHLYRLSTMASDDLYVTEEHPFYVRRKSRIRIKKDGKTKQVRHFSEPEWINAKDLSKDYYVGIAINKESRLPDWNGITITYTDNKKDRPLNNLNKMFDKNDFWWIIGRFIGDGWIRNRYDRKDKNSGIIICCDFDETNDISKKLDSLGMNYCISNEETTNKFHIVNKELGVYCEQFGRGALNKKVTGDIINLPVDLLKGFLDGYMSADGCYTQGYYKATSVSNELIYGLGQCIAKVYKRPFSVYKTKRPKECIIEGRTVNQNDTYEVKFKLEKKVQDKAFYEDGYIWCPINNIEKEKYKGYVYNMEVENDNSYVVQNIIVHNCQDLSSLGDQKGFFNENGEKTRSGLFFDAIRIMKHKMPKVAIIENVRALVSKPMKENFEKMKELISDMGYNFYHTIMNTKDYGLPHSRNRFFGVCIRKDVDTNKFEFPEKQPLTTVASDYYDDADTISDDHYLEEKHHKYFNEMRLKKKYSSLNSDVLVCMTTKQGQKSNPQNFVCDKKGYRILTAPEMFALQGFKKDDAKKLLDNGITTSQVGYMCGNTISVCTVEHIFRKLIEALPNVFCSGNVVPIR